MRGKGLLASLGVWSAATVVGGGAPEGAASWAAEPSGAPVVRAVAPGRGAFILPQDASKLLVVVEITDPDGSGLEMDPSGVPVFAGDDANIDLFRDGVIAHGTFTKSNGQAVTMVVSQLPAAAMQRRQDRRITAPVDWTKVTPRQREEGFSVPPEGLVEFATIDFVVRNRKGVASAPPDDFETPSRLIVGFASALYVPPPELN